MSAFQSTINMIFILPFLLHVILSEANDKEVMVKSKLGMIQGTLKTTSPSGLKFSSFQGIPYAQSPVNELRFKPPQTITGFNAFHPPGNPLLATQLGKACVQIDYYYNVGEAMGSEDCLNLNIYSPVTDFIGQNTRFPVMIWIHGGGFQIGSGGPEIYGPERLLEYGVVVVTLNYRLGPLGFLTTGDANAPPNVGLLDQRMAMYWVKENIEAFGGNKEQVTLFGQSAGGMSVMYHVASPGSKGLFHRAISMSGVFGDHALLHLSRPPTTYTRILAKKLGCEDTDDSLAIVQCLRSMEAIDLVKQAAMFRTFQWIPEPFKPVLDTYMPEPVVPGLAADIWKDPQLKTVPLLVGGNKDDGGMLILEFMLGTSNYSTVQENFPKFAPTLLFGVDPDVAERDETETATAEILRQTYLGGGDMDNINKEDDTAEIKHPFNESQRGEIINLFTDVHFLSPIDTVVRALAKASSPVYYYNYQHQGSLTLATLLGIHENLGVNHLDELLLLWKAEKTDVPIIGDLAIQTDEDEIVSKKLLKIWTDFAKTGKATSDGAWRSIQEAGKVEYAVIDSKPLRMEYPEEFNRRMKLVQQMINLATITREVIPEDIFGEDPAFEAILKELKIQETEINEESKKKKKESLNDEL